MTKQVANKDINNLVQVKEERRIEPFFKKTANGDDSFRGLSIDGRNIEITLNMPEEERSLITTALKDLTGHSDINSAMLFLMSTAETLHMADYQTNIGYLISFLNEMKPEDAIEAKLITQFLVLDASANKMLHNAKSADIMLHAEFNYKHGIKAMNIAQQVIQALTKYKAKGTQQINIVHMNGDSKAVFTGGGG